MKLHLFSTAAPSPSLTTLCHKGLILYITVTWPITRSQKRWSNRNKKCSFWRSWVLTLTLVPWPKFPFGRFQEVLKRQLFPISFQVLLLRMTDKMKAILKGFYTRLHSRNTERTENKQIFLTALRKKSVKKISLT